MLRRGESIERQILMRQLSLKDLTSNSWTTQVKLLLHKYRLPSAYQLADFTPKKDRWKKMVKNAVTQHWIHEMKQAAEQKSTLKYLHLPHCERGEVHPVWRYAEDPDHAHMATVKAKLLVGRYPLAANWCAGKKKSDVCPLCHGPPESTTHFLAECAKLEKKRRPYIRKIERELNELGYEIPENSEEMARTILEPPEDSRRLQEVTRRLCYSLHNERETMLNEGEPEGL